MHVAYEFLQMLAVISGAAAVAQVSAPRSRRPAIGTAELLARLQSIGATIGFSMDTLHPSLVARMGVLHEYSEIFHDAQHMATLAERLFAHVEAHKPEQRFSELERQTIVLGAVFADIGKTGPAEADVASQRLIAEMFSIENVDDDTVSVAAFLQRYFPEDASARIERFATLGLEPGMPIRQFWNLHAGWTLAIAQGSGLPLEAVAAAATHHLLEGVNPEHIVDAAGQFTREFGENPCFDRAEKLVIVLDKYDALLRRAKLSHEGAVQWLRARLQKSPRFSEDPEFVALIDDVDAALDPEQ